MSWFKKLFSGIARVAQLRSNLGGRLFLEHLTASIVVGIISVALIPLLGSILLIFFKLLFRLLGYFGIEMVPGTGLSGIAYFLGPIILFFPTRLVLVFKKEGVLAFLAALVGELIFLIPFLGVLYYLYWLERTLWGY